MEFEKNKPTTAQDIALADAQKVTLQPLHVDVAVEPISSHIYQQADATFAFEHEATVDTQRSRVGSITRSHHLLAFVSAATTAVIFGGILFWLSLQR